MDGDTLIRLVGASKAQAVSGDFQGNGAIAEKDLEALFAQMSDEEKRGARMIFAHHAAWYKLAGHKQLGRTYVKGV